jgi:membrane fusion protein, macrolide-specific efflux system
MKMTKKNIIISIIAGIVVVLGLLVYRHFVGKKDKPETQEVTVEAGLFQVKIPASGTVRPENKIAINSPIAGRIEQILVEEGQKVKKGQVLAWMSSTDRAALMDSASAQDAKSIQEWKEVYKPSPITSPANGEIISRNIVVGQTVSSQTLLFELSDRLVVVADLDETDVGKIHPGQIALIKVDSFPELEVTAKAVRVAKQSQIKNNINTYEVLLIADKLPVEFRAGMTANTQFIYLDKPDSLLIPTWVAEGRENFSMELRLKPNGENEDSGGKPILQTVKFGNSNGEKIEILEGAKAGDVFVIPSKSVLSDAAATPFGVMGGGRKRR